MYSIMHLQGLSYSFCPAMQWGRLVNQLLEPAKVLGWLVGLPSDYFWLVDWWLVCLCVGRFVNWLVCWSIVCCLVDFVLLFCLFIGYFGSWLFLFVLHIGAKLVCILVGMFACLLATWVSVGRNDGLWVGCVGDWWASSLLVWCVVCLVVDWQGYW